MQTIDKLLNSKRQLWLNVGSGSYAIADFVHFDNSLPLQLLPLYPLIKPFLTKERQQVFEHYREAVTRAHYIVHDCSKPLPLPAGCADHILASHFLEHLHRKDAEVVTRGFYNTLKPGGTLHVIVPDLVPRVRRYANGVLSESANMEFIDSLLLTSASKPSVSVRWREFVGGFGLFHRWMYDLPSMTAFLEKAGFFIEPLNESPSSNWRREDDEWQVNILARKPLL